MTNMLNLSAGFDIVDHTMMLQRLTNHFGVRGTALGFIQAFSHAQSLSGNGRESLSRNLQFGVPQGSVLGPHLIPL